MVEDTSLARGTPVALAGIGIVTGILSGVFGVGGGFIMVPAMVLLLAFGQHRAQATSLAGIVPIASVGALIFAGAGNVDYLAAAILAAGTLFGVQLGVRVMDRLSPESLSLIFAAFLLLLAGAMFFS